MTTYFGYKGNEKLFPSLEERGVAYEIVDGVIQFRPMAKDETNESPEDDLEERRRLE